ncbi:MAG: class I SAM-dependent methyltransferase [Planctomycetota bacterium]
MSRSEFGEIAREHYRRRDYTGAFEALYAQVEGDAGRVPWADLRPNPILRRWLDGQKVGWPSRPSGRPTGETPVPPIPSAAVVGCGLGDDANLLAEHGYDTLGFDVAPTAIDWARRRFTHDRLRFEAADLFDLPAEWRGAFELVIEIYTFQSLPLAVRPSAMDSAASLVAPGGTLLVICRGRDEDEPATKLPFPLLKSELGRISESGLVEARFEDFMDDEAPPVRRFIAEYERPRVGATQ